MNKRTYGNYKVGSLGQILTNTNNKMKPTKIPTDPHDPAYPTQGNAASGELEGGLTKLEYFAGLAMQGLLSNSTIAKALLLNPKEAMVELSKAAKEHALDLIKVLNEPDDQ